MTVQDKNLVGLNSVEIVSEWMPHSQASFPLASDFHAIKVPAKRSQHVNATYRNNVGRNMLRTFGHRVAMCCSMLGVVGSSLKLVKFGATTPNMS